MIHALNITYGPQNKALVVKFAPAAAEGHLSQGPHPFVFGSAGHPSNFRCQSCGQFAWDSHGPADAWGSDTHTIEHLGRAALELVNASRMPVSTAMSDTLAAWRKSLGWRQ